MASQTFPAARYRDGRSELTRVGYGAMQLAGPGVFGPPKDRDAAIAVLRAAVDLGITHIDTSDFYGPHVTNEIIQEALRPYPGRPAHRHQGRRPRGTSKAAGRTRGRLRSCARQVHDNLRAPRARRAGRREPARRRHRGTRAGLDRGAVQALAELRQQGLIRHLGLSTVTAAQVAEAQTIAPVVCVQNLYNIARRGDDALVDLAGAQGIAYVPYFPLGGFTPLQSRRPAGGCDRLGATPMAGRARLAAAALTEHPADPRHVVGGTPARERRGRRADAAARGDRGTRRDRPLSRPGGLRRPGCRISTMWTRPGSSWWISSTLPTELCWPYAACARASSSGRLCW